MQIVAKHIQQWGLWITIYRVQATVHFKRDICHVLALKQYGLLGWFVGLNMDDPIWDVTVFTKNRERLLDGDIAEAFFRRRVEASLPAEPALGRAPHIGRNAVGSLGEFEEFSGERR